MQHPLYNKVFPIFDIFRFEQNKTKPNRNEGMEPRQHMVDDMKERRRWWVECWWWWWWGAGLDSRQGPRLVLTSHRPPAVNWCCSVCVCVRACSRKNIFNQLTIMKLEAGANDIFAAINTAFINAQIVQGHSDLSIAPANERSYRSLIRPAASLLSPQVRSNRNTFLSLLLISCKKKTRFPQRCGTHGNKSNKFCCDLVIANKLACRH